MMGGLRGRFGRNGIYRDPRILIPIVVLGLIRLVSSGYTPEQNVQNLQLEVLQEQVRHQQHRAPAAPAAVPEAGTYEIQQIRLDGTDEGWMPSPLLVAGVAGGGLAAMGAAGALLMLRRHEESDDDFYGDAEISELVARHEGR